jgi:DNA-binding transcriptional MerR regulator
MEKSAAYLLGFQAGFDEGLSLEKIAQVIELLEFVPETPQQAEAFLRKNAAFLSSLEKRILALKKLLSRPDPKIKLPAASVPTSLNVAALGQKAKTFDVPGMRGSASTRLPMEGQRGFGNEGSTKL